MPAAINFYTLKMALNLIPAICREINVQVGKQI